MKKLIVIADYVNDTLALALPKKAMEKSSRGFGVVYLVDIGIPKTVYDYLNINFISSTPNTIHAAYLLSQIVYTEERYRDPQETVIFINVDPRLQKQERIKEAEGAIGLIIKLASGIYITGPNTGYVFSLIKDKIAAVYSYDVLAKGSQFRSRDLYSRVIAHLIDYLEDELELEQVNPNLINTFRGFHVGHIDNYGNIKTTITKEDFKGKYEFHDQVKIIIGKTSQTATFVDNLFGGEVGELVVYPGSSGHRDNPYLEISAWSHFGNDETISKTGKDFFPEARPADRITF